MNPNKVCPSKNGTLWGFNTLEQTRRLGQQTYQRALSNYAAAWRDQQEPTVPTKYINHRGLEQKPCPICGKLVQPNHHLEAAFSEVMKMMSQISQSCEMYYCSTGKEQVTPHDKKHCLRYHSLHPTLDSVCGKKIHQRETTQGFPLYHIRESPFMESFSKLEATRNKHHTTFDIAASLPSTRKAKHMRFSPGDTVEINFCA